MTVGLSMSGSADNHNCGDYVSQAAAQSVYNADKSDPKGLDGPPGPTPGGDPGVACEDYDYASNPGTNPGLLGGGGDDNGDDNGDTDNGDDNGDDNGTTTLPETGTGAAASTGTAASLFGAVAGMLLIVGAAVRRTAIFRA